MPISVFDIFKIGIGPSSSHTVGPMKAAKAFVSKLKQNNLLQQTSTIKTNLYGSLAATGKGHGTHDAIILGLMGFDPDTVDTHKVPSLLSSVRSTHSLGLLNNERPIVFNEKDDILFHRTSLPYHSNGIRFFAKAGNNANNITVDTHNQFTPASSNGLDANYFASETFYSVGGGFIISDEDRLLANKKSSDKAGSNDIDSELIIPFPFKNCKELMDHCSSNNLSIAALMMENERAIIKHRRIKENKANNKDIKDNKDNNPDDLASIDNEIFNRLNKIWQTMHSCVENGLSWYKIDEILPGGLGVRRRAPKMYADLIKQSQNINNSTSLLNYMDWVNVFALSVNEENACGGRVVTAPTNGAAGVIPAVLHYFTRFHTNNGVSHDNNNNDKSNDLLFATPLSFSYLNRFNRNSPLPVYVSEFLLTSAAVGIIFKIGASISGAEAGCQGEVGVASSMAAAGLTAILGGNPLQIENAAEIAMEHHLGMTCDPVGGLVQIPCIERNTMGAIKSLNAATLSLHGDGRHCISLDGVVKVMKNTGADMKNKYKETSKGGLAQEFKLTHSQPHTHKHATKSNLSEEHSEEQENQNHHRDHTALPLC